MFELAITNKLSSTFASLPENRYGFSPKLHESLFFSDNNIRISGLRFKGDDLDFIENEEHLVAIVGKVFYRLAFSSDLNFISASEVLKQFKQKKETFINYVKGTFIIVIYNKKGNDLLLVKDQLGLKYLYYKNDKGNYFISTNLNDFKLLSPKINYSAVVEKILFTYPITEESYFEDVFMLKNGCILNLQNGEVSSAVYFSVDQIFSPLNLLKKFSKQTFIDIFEKSVLQRASVSANLNVSLTGGFDGRSIVAVLLNHNYKFHSYSFGKQGGENTEVPMIVSQKLGLDYESILLEEVYENNYSRCALDAIHYSDGTSSFERANYIYAIEILASRGTHYNISGLLGGEVFAPVRLKTDYINGTYYDLMYLGLNRSTHDLLEEKGIKEYINEEIIDDRDTLQKLASNVEERRKLINVWRKDECGWVFYLKDFVSLGFQQFYGNQIHLERYFNDNQTPFYDIDLLEYLYSTEHVYSYMNAFKDSVFLRRNNRKLQTMIIRNFSKALSEIPVDRGYPPAYTTDLRKLLIPFIFYRHHLQRKRLPPEFDSPAWSKILYKGLIDRETCFSHELLSKIETISSIEKYNNSDYSKDFNNMLSIAIWLNQ